MKNTDAVAVVILSPASLAAARQLTQSLPGARLHAPALRVSDADVAFADAVPHLRGLFSQKTPIIAFCAVGILVRALADVLSDKHNEPPVLAVSADSMVVPVLGGHHGANRLAQKVAGILGGRAVCTTAGDSHLGFALDEPPEGWRIANPESAKALTAALLAGEPVALSQDAGGESWPEAKRFCKDAPLRLRVTDKHVAGSERELVAHPPLLALGVGCERGADPSELQVLALQTLADAGLSALAVACVTSATVKEDEPAVIKLAEHLGVPARFFTPARLEDETPRLANPSETVFRTLGCHGVAEAAALAAAGPHASLIVPKQKSARATCAIARAAQPIAALAVGQAHGELYIVGIGPGAPLWRTGEALRFLALAEDVVGYGPYLDLVADCIAGKTRYESALGAETERAEKALALAATGRRVALIGSGDAGIYALAALAFERMDRADRPEWKRISVQVTPGITAMQAAASRLGAPLGHDFCAISLSDLLTPRETILRRVEAAAAGDFVISFYNPVSQRRRDLLALAREILLKHRPADTPVALARNLGRDGETVRIVTLADLVVDDVDMLTLVMVGSSSTRRFQAGMRSFIYTPRGYAAKENG